MQLMSYGDCANYTTCTFKVQTTGPTPLRKTPGSAGFDLYAPKAIDLRPGERAAIHTGVKVALPKFHFGLLVPRSSLGVKGLILANTVGIIDSDYRGEIIANVLNVGDNPIYIAAGERCLQLIVTPFLACDAEIVDSLDNTERGAGGFGSTGS